MGKPEDKRPLRKLILILKLILGRNFIWVCLAEDWDMWRVL
jgi:hypothetical protein